MEIRLRRLLVLGGVTVAMIAALACGTDLKPVESRVTTVEKSVADAQATLATVQERVGKIDVTPGVRDYYLTGVEWKGTTSADELQPPDVDPTTLSQGYRYKAPGFDQGKPQNWQVASYGWTPGSVIAYQGDTVRLTAFIVNGNDHFARLVAPDGTLIGEPIKMNRGREYKLEFAAAQTGVYKLVCDTHGPSMIANILVLPTS